MEVALWCLAVGALWAGCVFLFSRKRERERAHAEEFLVRTAEHDSMLLALKTWMADHRIVKVCAEQRHISEVELVATAEVIDQFSFDSLQKWGAFFLRNREVRRAVAKFEEKRGGVSHTEAMRPLLEWVTSVPTQPEASERVS